VAWLRRAAALGDRDATIALAELLLLRPRSKVETRKAIVSLKRLSRSPYADEGERRRIVDAIRLLDVPTRLERSIVIRVLRGDGAAPRPPCGIRWRG
jgi:hypothetical protein